MSVAIPMWGRPTVYKGIKMRSRLEAWYAAELDKHGRPWEYEPCAFADETGQYLPDFLIHDDEDSIYVDTKGVLEDLSALMTKMEIIWHSDPDAYLLIVFRKNEARWWGGQDPLRPGRYVWVDVGLLELWRMVQWNLEDARLNPEGTKDADRVEHDPADAEEILRQVIYDEELFERETFL